MDYLIRTIICAVQGCKFFDARAQAIIDALASGQLDPCQCHKCVEEHVAPVSDIDVFHQFVAAYTHEDVLPLSFFDVWAISQAHAYSFGQPSFHQMPAAISEQQAAITTNATQFVRYAMSLGTCICNPNVEGFNMFADCDLVIVAAPPQAPAPPTTTEDIIAETNLFGLREVYVVDFKNVKTKGCTLFEKYYLQLQTYRCLLEECHADLTGRSPVTKFMLYNSLYGTVYTTDSINILKEEVMTQLRRRIPLDEPSELLPPSVPNSFATSFALDDDALPRSAK